MRCVSTLWFATLLLAQACALDWTNKRVGGVLMDGSAGHDAAVDAAQGDASHSLTDASARDASPGAGDGAAGDAGQPSCEDSERVTFYRDGDNDGVGGSESRAECAQPDGYVTDSGDCNDARSDVYPGAVERCNGRDDDCDPTTEDGVGECHGFVCTDEGCATSCTSAAQCLDSLSCVDGECLGALAIGAVCAAGPYCQSGVCECSNAACTERRCASAACPVCSFVNAAGSTCSGMLDGVAHQTCAGTSSCVSGHCEHNNGVACEADANCKSGVCECANAACTAKRCASSACAVCTFVNAGGTSCSGHLTGDHACAGSCVSGVCKANLGGACETDANCVSGICNPGKKCEQPGTVDTGGACKYDASCASGACSVTCTDQNATLSCNATKTCKQTATHGQYCDSDADCAGSLICFLASASRKVGRCSFPLESECTAPDPVCYCQPDENDFFNCWGQPQGSQCLGSECDYCNINTGQCGSTSVSCVGGGGEAADGSPKLGVCQ